MDRDTDVFFLKEAYRFARKFGTDPSTQNGAVLVSGGNVVALGANHFPDGVHEQKERWERPLKYSFVEHAERNVIYDAAKRGIATNKLTMYCPWFACADCGRAIIQAGIREVVGHKAAIHQTRPDWSKSIAIALGMFTEAGVLTRWIEGELGMPLRFDGAEVTV